MTDEPVPRSVYLTVYRGQIHTAALALEAAIWAVEQAQQFAIKSASEFPQRADIAQDRDRIDSAVVELRQIRHTLRGIHGGT